MTLQKAGGLAALGTSGTYFVLVFIFAVVIPHLGIATPGDVSNPTRGMGAVASTPAPFFIINVTYLLFGLFDVLLFLALRERLHTVSPTRMLLAVIAASIGAGLLVAAGLVSLTGLPKIVSAQDVSAYRALNLVTVGLLLAGTFATGWAEVLTGVTGLTKHSLPKILSFMLLLDGLVEIFEFLFPFFVMVDSAFGLIMGMWLGILLLRNGERVVAEQKR